MADYSALRAAQPVKRGPVDAQPGQAPPVPYGEVGQANALAAQNPGPAPVPEAASAPVGPNPAQQQVQEQVNTAYPDVAAMMPAPQQAPYIPQPGTVDEFLFAPSKNVSEPVTAGRRSLTRLPVPPQAYQFLAAMDLAAEQPGNEAARIIRDMTVYHMGVPRPRRP